MFPPGFNPADMLGKTQAAQEDVRKKTEELLLVSREIRDLLQKILKALNGEEPNA